MLLLLLLSHFGRFRLCATHRRQPTRLRRPWDSPGKNTRVDCHFLLQCIKVKSESKVSQLCPALSDPMDCSLPGSSVHGIFQARVLEWGAIAFSEQYCSGLLFPSPGDLPDPGIKPVSPVWQADSSPLSHAGKPTKLSYIISIIIFAFLCKFLLGYYF